VPDTPNRPGSARASPRKESQSRVQTVAAQNFYSVAPTKSFKDWDEDLCLAPAFLVERDGVLMRSDQVKVMEEQEATIKTLEGKVTAKSNQIDKLAKQNKDGKQQQKLDKLTAELETLMDKLEYQNIEFKGMEQDSYYAPGAKPVQIAPAKSVPYLGEIQTKRTKCLVPRAFFKRTSQDKDRLQAKHAALVLAHEYHGESWLV